MNTILIWGVLDMKTLFIQKCLASNQICLARAAAEGNPGYVTWVFHTYTLKIERALNGVDAVNLIIQTASGRNWSSVNATIKRLKHLFLGDLELLNDEFD
ncbi:hypothetical protein DPX16_5307 [Anabarilius grahami]|uniref:Uncharacterized protein n=1 Tax=Anabarilius grahami TaxID=495550 RepID=A0A3N0XU52_ANAGA|nr:hypothetical protein DPX16_5307 [Anabarilius grahami]